MASLLTDAEKSVVQSALSDMHDTFARNIFVYVEETSSVPVELNFNPLYGRRKNTAKISSEQTLTKYTFSARIFYKNEHKEDIVDGNGQMNLMASEGQVRIKVKSDAYEKIKICSRIEVDDQLYIVDGDAKVIGPFDAQFYSIFLKREN
ncbi:MAG TPA: hypothetical protein DF712_09100 [Balneola sp.]|nr:hypothetical protein [Balneola sp.]|tara:strand:+ start:149 stop:595 length:447 start_codon:yes stop_codon:yes gene_type:complete